MIRGARKRHHATDVVVYTHIGVEEEMEKARDTMPSVDHERVFWELMRECRDNPPGARLSSRLRHHLERLTPDDRRALVSRKAGGCAPLFVAARRGHAEAVEYLVHVCCADVEQRGVFAAGEGRDPHHVTPLWAAAVAGRLDALRALLDAGADPDAPSDSGSTPARSACFMTHVECVRLLAERGANLARPNHHGSTCLINAVQSPRLVRYLLSRGVAVDATDAQGKTALHYAVQEHRADTVRVLLAAGANPRRADRAGDDALRTAAARGAAPVVAVLAAAAAAGAAWEPARVADAHELLGATQLDELNDLGAALASWRRATALRHAPDGAYVAKRPVRAPIAALEGAREWTSLADLDALADDVDALRTQALLVAVRVLGPHHKDTLFRIMYRGAAYADAAQFERGVALWLWALELRVARDTLLAGDTAQTVAALTRLVAEAGAAPAALHVLAVLGGALAPAWRLLAARPRCRHQAAALETALRCSLHLLAVALAGGAEGVALAAARVLVASGARTAAGHTLLHLAAGELPAVRSSYFPSAGDAGGGPHGERFPRVRVVRLLLAAGAPVDALNGAGSTALHVAARAPTPGLAEALVGAGAHLDRPDGRGGATPARRLAAWLGNTLCTSRHVSLACRAAVALVASGRSPPPHCIPSTLATFLDLHRVPPRNQHDFY